MGREPTRRRVLELAGSATIVGLAGCTSSSGGSTSTTTTSTTTESSGGETGGGESSEGGEKPWESLQGVSEDQFKNGPVPEQYRTATSLNGETRDPSQLVSKDQVKYQEAGAAVQAGLAQKGHTCDNCGEFVPDKNGDGYGACLKVSGYIAPDDWCQIWEPENQ